jgi:stage V sporulation protein SpoVS
MINLAKTANSSLLSIPLEVSLNGALGEVRKAMIVAGEIHPLGSEALDCAVTAVNIGRGLK